MALARIIVALAAFGLMGGWASTVRAEVTEVCTTTYVDNVKTYSCVLKIVGATGGQVGGGKGRPALFRWEVERVPGPCLPRGTAQGGFFQIRMYRISTGALVSTQLRCLYPGDSPAAFAPPPPPTPAEIVVGQVQIMTLTPRLLPPPAGAPAVGPQGGTSFGALVQWQSVGWCDVPPPVVIDIGLRGWTARAELKPVKAVWRVVGPEPFAQTSTAESPGGVCGVPQSVASAVAGGAGAPFRWTPHQAGRYTVTLDVTWTGVAQYAYLGNPAGDIDLGEHTYSSTVSQTVLEAQAVAVGGG